MICSAVADVSYTIPILVADIVNSFLQKWDVSLYPSMALQAANTSINVKEFFC